MKKWHANLKTTLLKEMQHGRVSQPNNENTVDETEAQLRLLIGQMLTQVSSLCVFADYLRLASQYNSHTPVTVEALSFALWAMTNHTMTTCDQAKTLMHTFELSPRTTQSKHEIEDAIAVCELLVEDVLTFFYG